MSELPSYWVTRRLGDVAEVIMGQSPPGSTYNKSGDGVPFFQGKAEFGSKHPTVRQWTTAGTKFAKAGDVLMSVRAPVGPTNIADQDCAIGRGLAAIRAGSNLDQSYLIWYLKHVEASIQSRGKGTTFDAISGNDLRDTLVNLPPLDEQKRIVEALADHLSRLDKALADLEVAAKRSQHLFLAALEKAIEECNESTYKSLADCLNLVDQKKKVQRGWSPQCLSHPQSDSSKWAVLKTTAVQNMRYEPQHNKELPKTLEPKTHLEVQVGDFLMTTTGPRNRCGVVCLVTSTPKRLIFSGKILRFQPDSAKLHPAWLELVLASHRYQKQLDRLKVGSSDSSVSIGNAQVLELTVPVPSLAQQRRLVGDVEKMKALAERFEMEIEQEAQKFKELRRALLHAAFSGNLGSK